jgi:hypothetical protein
MNPIRPLIVFDRGQYRVDEDTAQWLSQRASPFAVLACAGKFRTGKSFLLNRLLARPAGQGFGVGETVQACTRGIWLCTETMTHNGKEVLVLDTEGIDALDADSQHDVRIVAIAVLICSAFAYNSMSHLDEAAVQTLSLMTQIAQSLKGGGHTPSLYWILRDFSLQMVDDQGKPLSNAEYLEQALQPPAGSDKCATRDAIRSVFETRHLVTLPRPQRGDSAQRLDSKGSAGTTPKFERYLNILREHICDHVQNYAAGGVELKGSVYVEHVRNIVRLINEKGAIPRVEDTWTLLSRAQESEVFSTIEAKVRSMVHAWTTPLSEPEAKRRIVDCAHEQLRASRFLTAPSSANERIDAIVSSAMAYANEMKRIQRSVDVARSWVDEQVTRFCASRPDAVLEHLPEDEDVEKHAREQLLHSFAGGALYAKIVEHVRQDARVETAHELDRLRHEGDVLREEVEALRNPSPTKPVVATEDASTNTAEIEEDEEPVCPEEHLVHDLERMLADNELRVNKAEDQVRVLEERNRLLDSTFHETMDAMREEVVAAERERDEAHVERDRLVEQKRVLSEQLDRMHASAREAHDKTIEMHKSMLDEWKRRDAEGRAETDAHRRELEDAKITSSVATNENRMLKRRVDELLMEHEESKRMKTSLHQMAVERAREQTERDRLKDQVLSLRSDAERLRGSNAELESRVAVLTATSKLESVRRSR